MELRGLIKYREFVGVLREDQQEANEDRKRRIIRMHEKTRRSITSSRCVVHVSWYECSVTLPLRTLSSSSLGHDIRIYHSSLVSYPHVSHFVYYFGRPSSRPISYLAHNFLRQALLTVSSKMIPTDITLVLSETVMKTANRLNYTSRPYCYVLWEQSCDTSRFLNSRPLL